MFHSDSLPNGQGYDPVFWGFQSLVVSEVANFLDGHGIGNDHANELFAVGKAELDKFVEHVEVVEPDGRTQLWPSPGYDRLTKSAEYVRECIKNEILEYWQKDFCVFIPPSTRSDMKDRLVAETGDWWAEPDDPMNHRWDSVFDGENLRPVNSEEGSATGVQPQWQQPIDPMSYSEQRKEIVETLAFLYSLCRDEIDRDIVDLRFITLRRLANAEQTGLSEAEQLIDNYQPMRPADIADQLGLKKSEVAKRLKQLEGRHYRHLDQRLPTKKRNYNARPDLPRDETGTAVVSPRRPGLSSGQRMTRQEYEQQVREKIREVEEKKREGNSKPKRSEDSYGQPDILGLETERLHKDEDGQWCYRGDCCPTPQ